MNDMERIHAKATRRRFLKGIGISSLVPFIPQGAGAKAVSDENDKKKSSHTILSCNIRVALPDDEVKGVGWPQRKDYCIEVIKKYRPDIVCLQEVIKVQAEDLRKAFPKFLLFGFDGPYMDAHPVGYHWVAKNPILFNTRRYDLTAAGTYWLSENPLVAGSKSWDTARARHANWIRLKDKASGKEFRVINLHLDHVSGKAKVQQLKMVAEESNQYLADFPQILTGDFNSKWGSPVFDSIIRSGWEDSYAVVHGEGDPGYTAHAFQGANYERGKQKGGKIDFVFCRGPLKPLASAIIKDHKNGFYPSDHYFLSAELELL